MNIAVISDIHAGKRNYRKNAAGTNINIIENEIYETLDKNIESFIKNKTEVVLIAGDVFHNSNPTTLAISKVLSFYKKLEENNIVAVTIAGNHDTSLSNSIANTHPFKNFENIFKKHIFVYNEIKTVKFTDFSIVCVPHFTIDDEKNSMNEIIRKIYIESKKIDNKKFLLTHGANSNIIKRFLSKENQDIVDYMIFPEELLFEFDYSIIGHIHQYFVQEKTDDSLKRIISPGSIIDDNNYKIVEDSKTGPVYISTITDKVTKEIIDTIKVYTLYTANIAELEEILAKVDYNVYYINHCGTWDDVDKELYKNAIENSVFFSLQLRSQYQQVNHSSVTSFWEWMTNKYPKLLEEFKNIVKEEI